MVGPPRLPIFAVILIWTATTTTTVIARIQVVDHGYEGIVVAISEGVVENPYLLTRLESLLTESSKALFRATRYQLYFKEFIITIPKTWQNHEHYETALDADAENFSFLIDLPNPLFEDLPYTRPYKGCGYSQSHAHITPAFILNHRHYSGRTIVHEWGHLRWGLFNEYQFFDNDQDKAFYRQGNQWHPTRCSTEIDGQVMNPNTGEGCEFDFAKGSVAKNNECHFFLNVTTKATASLMFVDFLDNVVEFCDDPRTAPTHLQHNRLAPNLQNRMCDNLSAWEVMRKHSDFINLSDVPALPSDTDTRPKFRYARKRHLKQVLVLDVSGSMEGMKLTKLVQAATSHILTNIEDGSQLGIVQFSDYGYLLSNLVLINSDEVRDILIEALPNGTISSTSIGAGLQLGLEVLTKDGPGGSILLVTDGEENESPWIEDIKPRLLEKDIPVHAISIGQDAEDSLRTLADVTGGKIIFYSGNDNSTVLVDGFMATAATPNGMTIGTNVSLSILTDATVVTAESPVHKNFVLDSTIGRETYLTFSYTEPIKVEIHSPDGPYSDIKVKDLSHVQVLRIGLGDELTSGPWAYRVTTKNSSAITVSVQSKPRYSVGDIIQAQAWIDDKEIDLSFDPRKALSVYTEVLRGKKPVVGASVRALVERPNTDIIWDLFLKDDGRVSDLIKGDGIYSGNILKTDFTGDGRYNIKVQVEGAGNQVKEVVARSGSAGGALDLKMAVTPKRTEMRPLEGFQRVATPGEFHVKNFTNVMEDEVPPAKIMDLDVKTFNLKTLESTLVWTAVGGDMERGRASQYIIYIVEELEDIIEGNGKSFERILDEDVIRGNLSLPSTSGTVEEFIVHVKALGASKNKTVFLSVVAMDERGNKGERSNVVSLSRAEEFSVPVLGLKRIGDESDDSDATSLAAGLSVTLCVLFLMVFLLVLLYVN